MGTIYIAAFIVACASSFSATPFAIWLSRRWGVLDIPDARKVHQTPIPRWGGLGIYIGIIMGVSVVSAKAAARTSETHRIKVHGEATYRCYGGYGTRKDVDSRTKVVCDNKTYKKTLIEETITLRIAEEPNPDDSKDLGGDWGKDVPFEGRKFTAAISLFKTVPAVSKTPYRLRVVAQDDEPGTRATAIFAEADSVKNFNALTVSVTSYGQPEEIQFDVSLEPID